MTEAVVGGPAMLGGSLPPVMVLGQQKGRQNTKGKFAACNFGCPNPEGYRKALRLMRLAEKFHMPLISLVDTPGAYPGIGAEERHVAEAIAVNLRENEHPSAHPSSPRSSAKRGSGGACSASPWRDVVLILQNAYYSG